MSNPINNPTWAGPSLLTPLYLEALMIGQKNQEGDWAAVAVDYSVLGLRGGQPQPTPFQIAKTKPPTGIHLLWTAPAALRNGQMDDLGQLQLPLLPNRWLVTRSFIQKEGDTPIYTAWVLQSDFLGTGGTHPFPDPSGANQTLLLGRRFDLANWTGAAQERAGFLRAMGPGDPSYVAIYNNMTNVLAFFDDMQNAGNGIYSYSVCGWYARPNEDPLLGVDASHPAGFTTEEEWQQIMDKMLWTVGDQADLNAAEEDWQAWLAANPITGGPALTDAQKNWPGQNLCHGFLYNLRWQGADKFYDINPILNGKTPPTVAIGANSAEALAAWLGQQTGSVSAEDMLLAFQQDMIFDYVKNPSVFATRSQEARFANNNGGSQWVVYQEDQTSSATQIPEGSFSVPLTPEATAALVTLNQSQFILDGYQAQQISLQTQLYEAYWKLENVPRGDSALLKQIQDQVAALTQQVNAIQVSVTSASAQVESQKASLLVLITPAKLKLNSVNLPRFQQRLDPVILVAGANQDNKFAPPGISEDDLALFTRFTGQTIFGIQVIFAETNLNQTLYRSDFPQIIWPQGTQIPKEMADYWFECFLLDTNNANLIAKTAFTKAGTTPSAAQLTSLTAQIQRQQTALWNQAAQEVIHAAVIAETAGMLGVPPAKQSVSSWSPPWAPVYLDWEVEWRPTATTPQQMFKNWRLAEFDYEWDGGGGALAPVVGNYVGRTILNGQVAQGLSDKLNQFLNTDPNAASLPIEQLRQLQQMADEIAQYDVLTQSMSGMIQQMIMQQLQMSKLNALQTVNGLSNLVEQATAYLPAAGSTMPFLPIHAGHFRIVRLNVVDAFGQILRGTQLSDNLQPIRSQSLVTQGFPQYMQLTPRITQNLRMDLRMVQYDNDQIRSNSSDLTSAICGWIIPNHINHSLIVFDPLGNNLGELLMIDNGNDGDEGGTAGTGLRWDAVPGSNSALGAPPEFPPSLRHLNNFVNGLLLRGAQGSGALQSLLDVIDSSLWRIDPLGQPIQGNLAVLLGRPIALVRALVTLGVGGTPAYSQTWANTGKNVTYNFTNVPLTIRVGDIGLSHNGTMGYFLDDDYSSLFPYYGYTPKMGTLRRVMADQSIPSSEKLANIALRLDSDTADTVSDPYLVANPQFSLPADNTTTHSLTMLVDPRGWIPAISGLLPVQWLSLPAGPVNAALSNMYVTFRSGPLLLNSPIIRLPLPANIQGKWSWVERSGVTTWRESESLVSSDDVASLPDQRPTLSEGWLKLSGAQGIVSARQQRK